MVIEDDGRVKVMEVKSEAGTKSPNEIFQLT